MRMSREIDERFASGRTSMVSTRHAQIRVQQLGIPPPLIEQWLDEFSKEQYDGHGGVRRYFSHKSIRAAMERAFGRKPVRCMAEYLDAFKVESSRDGQTFTLGHQTKHIRR